MNKICIVKIGKKCFSCTTVMRATGGRDGFVRQGRRSYSFFYWNPPPERDVIESSVVTLQFLPGLTVLVEALASFPLQELLYILAAMLKNLGTFPPQLTREKSNQNISKPSLEKAPGGLFSLSGRPLLSAEEG